LLQLQGDGVKVKKVAKVFGQNEIFVAEVMKKVSTAQHALQES
jgi:hypothetical protein